MIKKVKVTTVLYLDKPLDKLVSIQMFNRKSKNEKQDNNAM